MVQLHCKPPVAHPVSAGTKLLGNVLFLLTVLNSKSPNTYNLVNITLLNFLQTQKASKKYKSLAIIFLKLWCNIEASKDFCFGQQSVPRFTYKTILPAYFGFSSTQPEAMPNLQQVIFQIEFWLFCSLHPATDTNIILFEY